MSDVVIPAVEENPDIPVENEGFELVVGEGDAPIEDKSAELEVENARLKAQLEAAQAAPVAPADTGFADLAAEIRRMNPPVETAPQGTDYNAFLKEKGAEFYKDPAMTSAAISAQVAQDTMSPLQATINTQAMQISKLTMLQTPNDATLYGKYAAEVEEAATNAKNKGAAYQEAMKSVRANHMDELIQEGIQAGLNQAVQQAEANVPKASSPLPSDLSTMPRKAAQAPTRITNKTWDAISKWSVIKGYEIGTPQAPGPDMAWVVDYMKGKGVIR